jgi:hypothetical protein
MLDYSQGDTSPDIGMFDLEALELQRLRMARSHTTIQMEEYAIRPGPFDGDKSKFAVWRRHFEAYVGTFGYSHVIYHSDDYYKFRPPNLSDYKDLFEPEPQTKISPNYQLGCNFIYQQLKSLTAAGTAYRFVEPYDYTRNGRKAWMDLCRYYTDVTEVTDTENIVPIEGTANGTFAPTREPENGVPQGEGTSQATIRVFEGRPRGNQSNHKERRAHKAHRGVGKSRARNKGKKGSSSTTLYPEIWSQLSPETRQSVAEACNMYKQATGILQGTPERRSPSDRLYPEIWSLLSMEVRQEVNKACKAYREAKASKSSQDSDSLNNE